MRLTKKAFIAWLEEQPPDREFATGAWGCPLAAAHSGLSGGRPAFCDFARVGVRRPDSNMFDGEPLASWAVEFVTSVSNRTGPITAAEALELLR